VIASIGDIEVDFPDSAPLSVPSNTKLSWQQVATHPLVRLQLDREPGGSAATAAIDGTTKPA